MGKHSIKERTSASKYEQTYGHEHAGPVVHAADLMPEAEATVKVSRFARMLNRIRGGEKTESSTDRAPRRIARAAFGLISTLAVAFNTASTSAEAPAPQPETTTVVAYGAGMTNPTEAGKHLPVEETRSELRGLETDKVIIAGYPGRIINAPISLGDSGVGSYGASRRRWHPADCGQR